MLGGVAGDKPPQARLTIVTLGISCADVQPGDQHGKVAQAMQRGMPEGMTTAAIPPTQRGEVQPDELAPTEWGNGL